MHILLLQCSSHMRLRPLNVLRQYTQDSNSVLIRCLYGDVIERHLHKYHSTGLHDGNSSRMTLLAFTGMQNGFLVPNGVFHNNFLTIRNVSLSSVRFDSEPLKPSSKVEVTVEEIKKQQEKQQLPVSEPPKAVVKKSFKQKIVDELVHYYHGFRLLFIDLKISTGLVLRIVRGSSLTRREYKLLSRTVGDMFRLVPFSVFIIVPFMELLLPVFIKFFPGMLPSTFQSASDRENKIKQNLKVKLEMAKFLQQTLDDMAVQHKDHSSQQAKEFNEWFQKVRTSGTQVTTKEIMKYSKLFEDEITLDSLSRSQLVALCRVLEMQTLGTNNFLRFQLRMKLRSLAADDKMIQKEGIKSLTLSELQAACRARGMRAYGVSEQRLQSQLTQWLDLSLNEKVPPSLLLLSRALMLPETIPTSDKLKATISALPEAIATHTKVAIGEKEGKIDNKAMLQAIKEEERKVKEERKELTEQEQRQAEELKKQEELRAKEKLIDQAPIMKDSEKPMIDPAKIVTDNQVISPQAQPPQPEQLQAKDVEAIQHALLNISDEKKKLIVEKEQIQDLKEQMADYKEDVENLQKVQASEVKPIVTETKAAKRLFKSVDKMINKLDKVMKELDDKGKQIKKDLEEKATDEKKQELLQIDDIMTAIRKIQHLPNESREQQIQTLLKKMDSDYDGSVKVDHVLKVIELIGKENVNLNAKQVDELIELLGKEEMLEVEDKIEKALQKAGVDPKQKTPPPPPSVEDLKAGVEVCDDIPAKPSPTSVETAAPKPVIKVPQKPSSKSPPDGAPAVNNSNAKLNSTDNKPLTTDKGIKEDKVQNMKNR